MWLVLVWSSSAYAHSQPHGTMPFLEDDGEFVGGMTSYGLIQFDMTAGWTSADALPRLMLWAHYAGQGRVIAGTPSGVFETDDWGCSWAKQEGALEKRATGASARDPSIGGRIFAVTEDRDEPNTLFESRDNGRTWEETALSGVEGRLLNVVVSSDGAQVWVLELDAQGQFVLWWSSDGGGVWEMSSVALRDEDNTPLVQVALLGLSEDNASVFIAHAPSTVEQRLLRLDIATGNLEELATFDGLGITAFAAFAGRLFLVVDELQLFRSTPQGQFEEFLGGPTGCLEPHIQEGVLWGCGLPGHGANFLSSEDGETFSRHLRFVEICPTACPEETPGASLNVEQWPEVSVGVGALTCTFPTDTTEIMDAPEEIEPTEIESDEARDAPSEMADVMSSGSDGCAITNVGHSSAASVPLWIAFAALTILLIGRRRRCAVGR